MGISIQDYIRQEAMKRGIDPETALKVARGEGGFKDPFQHGLGPAPKSQDPSFGSTENSYGPFQLYISGTGSGLGDKALAAGIDPRKDWQAGVRYALDTAAQTGWGQWYGAKANGVDPFAGLKGAHPVGLSLASAPDGPKGQESYAPAVPDLPPAINVADHPVADVPVEAPAAAPNTDLGSKIAGLFKNDKFTDALKGLGSALGGGQSSQASSEAAQIDPATALASSMSADAGRMQAGQQLWQQLMASRKKPLGLSLMG